MRNIRVQRAPAGMSPRLLALTVGLVLLGLVTTVIATAATRAQSAASQRLEHRLETERAAATVDRRMRSYLEVLYGLRSLFAANDDVSRAEFATFVAHSDIAARYPGFQALTFTRQVPAARTAEYTARVRRDRSLRAEGHPGFTVHPPTDADQRYVVEYVEPLAGNEAVFGFDLGTDETRRQALMRARDTGEAVVTPVIDLIQSGPRTAGFLLLVPVYEPGPEPQGLAARRAAFQGLAGATFRLDDLFGEALADIHMHDIEIYDGGGTSEIAAQPGAATLLYDRDADSPLRVADGIRETVAFAGQRWTVVVAPPASRALAWELVLVAGLLSTAAAAVMVLSLARSRSRAVMLAERMTADLSRTADELRAARDRALAADRAKSEFLSRMSHELRTPLNGIIGTNQLLAASELDGQQRTLVEMSGASADALLAIVDDVLDLSAIQTGRVELVDGPFDLGATIREVVQRHATGCADGRVRVTSRVDRALPRLVTGDGPRFAQVLDNLVGNACKFTAEGVVHVAAEVTARDRQGVDVHLTVADTGSGIPPEQIERIFAAFEQVDTSTTRAHDGTGLGLPITRHLLRMMGGGIWVDSTVGEGSTFHVTCRFGVPGDDRAVPDAAVAGDRAAGGASPGGGRRDERVPAAEDLQRDDRVAAAGDGPRDGRPPAGDEPHRAARLATRRPVGGPPAVSTSGSTGRRRGRSR